MPKWMRLKSTNDSSFGHRMISALENGHGDEGPLATAVGQIGCLVLVPVLCIVFIGLVLGIISSPFVLIAILLGWI
jgi:hypothetical protein